MERQRRATGTLIYLRVFAKFLSGKPLTVREQRVLDAGRASSAYGPQGGYPVPPQYDPTIRRVE